MDFQNYLNQETVQIALLPVLINLALATVCGFSLRYLYSRFGRGFAAREDFSANFTLITVTTTLIITVVKSSLALSLGLVGALSVIRFRTAIKEPEELAMLFLCIAVGLGLGAGQVKITIGAFVFIAATFILLRWRDRKVVQRDIYRLIVSGPADGLLADLRKADFEAELESHASGDKGETTIVRVVGLGESLMEWAKKSSYSNAQITRAL